MSDSLNKSSNEQLDHEKDSDLSQPLLYSKQVNQQGMEKLYQMDPTSNTTTTTTTTTSLNNKNSNNNNSSIDINSYKIDSNNNNNNNNNTTSYYQNVLSTLDNSNSPPSYYYGGVNDGIMPSDPLISPRVPHRHDHDSCYCDHYNTQDCSKNTAEYRTIVLILVLGFFIWPVWAIPLIRSKYRLSRNHHVRQVSMASVLLFFFVPIIIILFFALFYLLGVIKVSHDAN